MTTGASFAQAEITLPTTPNGFETTAANGTLSNIGFIVSLCIVHHCAVYRNKSITQFNIRQNYNITEIPVEAFVGATNIEVCQSNIYEIIQSPRADPANGRYVAICFISFMPSVNCFVVDECPSWQVKQISLNTKIRLRLTYQISVWRDWVSQPSCCSIR